MLGGPQALQASFIYFRPLWAAAPPTTGGKEEMTRYYHFDDLKCSEKSSVCHETIVVKSTIVHRFAMPYRHLWYNR